MIKPLSFRDFAVGSSRTTDEESAVGLSDARPLMQLIQRTMNWPRKEPRNGLDDLKKTIGNGTAGPKCVGPADCAREIILLCWKMGEKFITHWHGVSEGLPAAAHRRRAHRPHQESEIVIPVFKVRLQSAI